jgi:hypothetical protein
MIFALTFNPAVACHGCYGWGGFQPSYYWWHGCGDCGGCEVVVDDCSGGCDSCGGCDSGGGCDSCDGVVVEGEAVHVIEQAAPQPPVETPAAVQPSVPATLPEEPATVERPLETAPVTPVVPPATTPEAAPATPPQEDLFDGTETTTPPATEPVTPETPPATEAPATDDLFGTEAPAESAPAETTPPAEPAAPAEAPAADESTDDLFGTESTESAPATDSAPAGTETPPQTPAEGEAPAEGESTDDIFPSSRVILREAGGLASSEMRVWIDNTGHYSVKARLVRFLDGHVQLLKDNGRTTTVPLNRLSQRDLRFVNRQASAQKAMTFPTAQAHSAPVGVTF